MRSRLAMRWCALVIATVVLDAASSPVHAHDLVVEFSGVVIWVKESNTKVWAVLPKADDEKHASNTIKGTSMLPLHHAVVILRSSNLSPSGSAFDAPVVLGLAAMKPWAPEPGEIFAGYDVSFEPEAGDTLQGTLDTTALNAMPSLDALTKGSGQSVDRKLCANCLGADPAFLLDIGGRVMVNGKLEPFGLYQCKDQMQMIHPLPWKETCVKTDGTTMNGTWTSAKLYEGMRATWTFQKPSVTLRLKSFELDSTGKPIADHRIPLYAQGGKVFIEVVVAPASDVLQLPSDHVNPDGADHLLLGYLTVANQATAPYCYPVVDTTTIPNCQPFRAMPFCPGGRIEP